MADAPDGLFMDAELTRNARLVGVLLWRHASHNDANPFTWVSAARLAELTSSSERDVRRALSALRERGHIDRAHRNGYRGWTLHRDVPVRVTGRTRHPDAPVTLTPASADPDACVTPTLTPASGKHDVCVIQKPQEAPMNPIESDSQNSKAKRPKPKPPPVTLAELLERHGAEWAGKFPALDGRNGRPTVEETCANAWDHKARKKRSDMRLYLQTWLRRENANWERQKAHKQRVGDEAPDRGPAVSPEERRRRHEARVRAHQAKRRAQEARGG